MQVGFFFWPYDVALVRGMAEAADAYGYDMIGIADTPGNAMDPWVAATLVAEHTLFDLTQRDCTRVGEP